MANGQTAYLILWCNPTVKLPILPAFVLLAAFIFLDLDLRNAVHCGYCCGGWAVSLFYCFLQTDVATRHIWSLPSIRAPMKVLSLFLFIALTPLISKGQFDFKSDSSSTSFLIDQLKNTELGSPNFDSIAFELRFWASGEFGGFLQLTFSQDSVWNYRRGFLNNQFELRILELPTEPNISSVWDTLVINNVLHLPNQNELIYTYHKDGRTIKLGPESEETEQLIHNTLDASGYTVQLFTNSKFRSYYYYNPVTLNQHFQNSEWESIETEMFANIVKTLSNSFNMGEIYRMNLREKMGKIKEGNKR